MCEKLYERENELIERLDNLEGCEYNPVYKKRNHGHYERT